MTDTQRGFEHGLLGLLERVMGIEPTLFAWEARVLPLNDTREALDYRQACRPAGHGAGYFSVSSHFDL